jgi:hypothetical protein
VDVRKWAHALPWFKRRTAGDEDAPGVFVGVVVTVLAMFGLPVFGLLAVTDDAPAGIGKSDDRRDAVAAGKMQTRGQVLFAIDGEVRDLLQFG